MNLTDLLVPTYRNMLQTLKGLLDKASAQFGPERAEALLAARLAPDMFPLATQVRFAIVQAYDGTRRAQASLAAICAHYRDSVGRLLDAAGLTKPVIAPDCRTNSDKFS